MSEAPIILETYPFCMESNHRHEYQLIEEGYIKCQHCSLVIIGQDARKISEIINKKIGSLHAA